jgi:hypothetical protein
MPPARRRPGPDRAALAELAGDPLPKAPPVDPVLGPGHGLTAADRAAIAVGAPPPVPGGAPDAVTVPSAAASAPTPATAPPAAREKSTFYDHPAGLARARAAYRHTHVAEGERSWAEFVAGAVRREVERREATYNGGRAWPGVGAGELPTGRPLRS